MADRCLKDHLSSKGSDQVSDIVVREVSDIVVRDGDAEVVPKRENSSVECRCPCCEKNVLFRVEIRIKKLGCFRSTDVFVGN